MDLPATNNRSKLAATMTPQQSEERMREQEWLIAAEGQLSLL
jgi:hypothetical protein